MRALIIPVIIVALLAAHGWAVGEGESPPVPDMQHGTVDHSSHALPMDSKPVEKPVHDPAMGHSGHAMPATDEHAMDHSGHDIDGMIPAEHDHEKMMKEAEKADVPVGIEEKLGNFLPSVEFTDSEGRTVNLKEFSDIPVILLPIYYRCPDVCNMLQGSIASILPDVKLEPGTEIKVVSFSFDPREMPRDAARAKRNYTAIFGDRWPADQWTFLTGDVQAIDATLGSIGYTVQKQGGLWAHPVAAIAVAPGGKVVRYLYGTTFLPFDITMAGAEAAEGKIGLSVKRLLSLCYNYDPDGRRYVFDILRVSGFSILGFIAIFLAWLLLGGKKKRR